MRKALIAVLVLGMAVSLTTTVRAEVQNVRLGGDIRIRGYYAKNLNTVDSTEDKDDFYLRQLSRISAEADLTDQVWAVATVEADGVWGQQVVNNLGWKEANDWDVDLAEAYIQLGEMYYSPISLKLGRQYLNYGNGFLISNREWFYKFDAARIVAEADNWTIDLIYSRLVESDTFNGDPDGGDDEDLFGLNLSYMEDLWTVEGYVFGIRDAWEEDAGDAKNAPIAVGMRFDASPLQSFDIWAEGVYEFGTYQEVGADEMDYQAFGLDVGAVYVFDVAWEPALSVAYTFASGGKADEDDQKNFYPFYNYNYYGYAYSPYLSNIGILNAQLSFLPSEDVTLIGSFYYYTQAEELAMQMGDPNQDNGGVMAMTNGDEKDLGMEFDAIIEYDYTEDVSGQLIGAWFKPGDAYEVAGNDNSPDDVFELRAEVFLSF